jgi:hypothetical protein
MMRLAPLAYIVISFSNLFKVDVLVLVLVLGYVVVKSGREPKPWLVLSSIHLMVFMVSRWLKTFLVW